MEGSSCNTDMGKEIWKALSEDLLIQILARLPIKSVLRFRGVCKSWKKMLQSLEFKQLVSTLIVSSTPAFIIAQERNPFAFTDPFCQPFLENLWISTDSSYKFHRLSLGFLPSPVRVVASCKSLLCCCGEEEIYICNPVTKTWLELPERGEQITRWDFISVAFDTYATCCTLIIGKNSTAEDLMVEIYNTGIGRNYILVEIYDSKTNKWIQLETTAEVDLVRPRGEGIYSNGKFYWLNEVEDVEILSVVSFDVEERQWNTIYGPQDSRRTDLFSQKLFSRHATAAGSEEHIVLVCARQLSLWKLSADKVGEKWCAVSTLDSEHDLRSLAFCMDIAVNENGCVLVFVPIIDIVAVWSEEGQMLQKTMLSELPDLSDRFPSGISVHAFEVNNIWWP